jgi:hypothetical protein
MAADSPKPRLVSQGLSGHVSMDVPAPPDDYGYGVSLYSTAWPLLESPLRDFQIGLASIWIVPENRKVEYPLLPTGTVARDHWPERGPSYRDVFQTIEGGLGFWGSTRFGSTTAKFRMNGTANGYNHELVIDQPSLQDADLSEAEKNRLQAVVEKIHAQWTMEKEYLPPPGMGTLAALDSALIVPPPKGFEIGYVPIATRQSPGHGAQTKAGR